MRGRMWWRLKQLLPLTYRSHYTDGEGRPHFEVWQMWLGKVFNYEDVILKPEGA